jgi:hypothetical protein
MNPRLFCRERSYHKALVLTYSFDPIFFEQVVLPDLWAGRSSEVLVLGDQNQIAASTAATSGQLWHLGKQYLLAGAKHDGAFHPKVLLRLGPKDGVIMLGSGNVTSSGWGGNQELATAWRLGPDHADKGGWLHGFLDHVLSWCGGDLEADAVRRMKDVPWLSLTNAATDEAPPILNSWDGQALAPMLASRWSGRRFDEVKILTGSTDESGAFLRWAHATLGVARATVALTPAAASFDLVQLAELPLEVRVIAAPPDRPLHAKLYWFDGDSGPAAVMGSANCSAAAWLVPPRQGGNVETAVVYDTPSGVDFASALTLFSAVAQMPGEVLWHRPERTDSLQPHQSGYALASLRWDNASRCVHADIRPAPSADMTVELVIGGTHRTLRRSASSGSVWECDLPEGLGAATTFASVSIRSGDKSWATAPRWIDDVVALQHAGQSARLLEPFNALERSATSTEKRRMLDDLNEVAIALFSDTPSFRDPNVGREQPANVEGYQSSPPVDPHDLICHLEEAPDSLPRFGSPRSGSLSLTGILRLLFDAEADDPTTAVASHDEQIDEGQLSEDGESHEPTTKAGRDSLDRGDAPVEARFREQLAGQMEAFLKELSSQTFAERCTATQMVQAVSFPLAVSLRGQQRGWVSGTLAEKWALEIFSILFRGSGAGGLLQAVAKRYADSGHQSTFNEVVGDGTLWLVLVATLGRSDWRGVGADFEKALALREVFTAPHLLAAAQASRVAGLLGKIRIEDAHGYITKIAPKVSRLLDDVEVLLVPVWKSEMQHQAARSTTYRSGDLLWRENVGWGVCLADAEAGNGQHIKVRLRGVEKVVVAGYYVNVTELAGRRPDLARLLDELRKGALPALEAAAH